MIKKKKEKVNSDYTQQLLELQKKYEHKNNELFDAVMNAFDGFRKIEYMTERNNYNNVEQKIRQIKEYSQEMQDYFAKLTLDTTIKNRTIIAPKNK